MARRSPGQGGVPVEPDTTYSLTVRAKLLDVGEVDPRLPGDDDLLPGAVEVRPPDVAAINITPIDVGGSGLAHGSKEQPQDQRAAEKSPR